MLGNSELHEWQPWSFFLNRRTSRVRWYSRSFSVTVDVSKSLFVKMLLAQRIFVLRVYFRTNSYRDVQTEFSREFPNTPVPNKSSIKRLVDKFNQTGNVADKPRSGAKPSATTPEKQEEVRNRVLQNRTVSTRRLATQLGISQRSVRRNLRALRLRPYRISCMQELLPPDFNRRITYCQWVRKFNFMWNFQMFSPVFIKFL